MTRIIITVIKHGRGWNKGKFGTFLNNYKCWARFEAQTCHCDRLWIRSWHCWVSNSLFMKMEPAVSTPDNGNATPRVGSWNLVLYPPQRLSVIVCRSINYNQQASATTWKSQPELKYEVITYTSLSLEWRGTRCWNPATQVSSPQPWFLLL